MSSGIGSSVSHNNVSETQTTKLVVQFNLHGKPIGDNKKKLNARALALAKVIFSVTYDKWNEIPNAKKEDLWESLLQRFDIPRYHKDNVLGQVSEQWRSWKKNIRKHYFGQGRNEILKLRDKVPKKQEITITAWNIFVEREATLQKIAQRARNKGNRSKKKDVHMLGAKSYSQVAEEWKERTVGTEDEGLEPNRVNLYVYARKSRKTGIVHPNVADDIDKISRIRSIQDESSRNDIDVDALSVVLGRDKRGRIRGVGKVPRTTIKATHPIVSELQQVKNDMHLQRDLIERQTSIIENEKVYLGQQGGADTIRDFFDVFVVWPINLLEKIV